MILFLLHRKQSEVYSDFYCLRGAPHSGQVVFPASVTKPHTPQAFGCECPNGAPHATQWGSPTGFAVLQYSQVRRRNLSEISCEAPRLTAALSIVSQILSESWREAMSWARSSNRPNSVKGLRNVESTVTPMLAAIPIHCCCPIFTSTPSSMEERCTVIAVRPPDAGIIGLAICTTR